MSTQILQPSSPVPALPRDDSAPPREYETERRERVKSFPKLRDFLNQTCKRIEELEKSKRLDILKQQNRCQAYYDDRHYGKFNERGEWEDLPYDQNEFRPVDNQYKIQIDKLQMEMARTGTDLTVTPSDESDARMTEAAAYVKTRVDNARRRIFTAHPELVLSENMSLLLKAMTLRYTFFDKGAKGSPTERRPLFVKKMIGGGSSSVCADCGRPRESEPEHIEAQNTDTPPADPNAPLPLTKEVPPCPDCGSVVSKAIKAEGVEVEIPEGEEEVPCGLVDTVHVDPTMVNLYLGARGIESSPWLVYTQMLMRGVVERAHPGKVIPTGKGDGDAERYRRENESGASNSPFDASGEVERGGGNLQQVKYELIWLDAWVYGDYQTNQREVLANGSTLEVGQKLSELFPDGMCVAKVGDTILDLYSEDKNKKWSMCVFGLREHALHGSGTNALIPVQNTINDLKAYRLANIYLNTAPREFFNPEYIEGGNLPTLQTACAVNNLPDGDGRIVGKIYDRAPGDSLPSEVFEFMGEQQGSLQEAAGTSSLQLAGTSAQTDALGTATGIAAMRDLAVGRMGPNLLLKAAMEVEHAYQVLELEQANYSKQHLMSGVGRRGENGDLGYTVEGVEAFLQSNIRADFLIAPTPGSWMPQTAQEKKADAIAFNTAAGTATSRETLAHLAKVFNQPLSLEGWNATEREASRRLREFAGVAQVIAQRGLDADTDELGQVVLDSAVNATMDAEMDDHDAFIGFYRDWWTSDEARTAPKCLKAAVRVRTREHKQGAVSVVQSEKVDALKAAIPDKLGQVISSEVDAAQQQGQAEDQQQLQMKSAEHGMLLQGVAERAVPLPEAMMAKEQILAQQSG